MRSFSQGLPLKSLRFPQSTEEKSDEAKIAENQAQLRCRSKKIIKNSFVESSQATILPSGSLSFNYDQETLFSMKPFEILFEDQHLIVLSKAPGILSQGDHSGDVNLVDLLRVHFGRHYVGLLHRLDRNTSGLMIVAKRSKSAERLTDQLQNGTLIRKYRAILEGTLAAPATWKHFLLKNESTNEVRVVTATASGAKSASLKVSPIKNFTLSGNSLTLAEFELETGRSHQIRVQSAAMKFPLIGDSKYGTPHGKTLFSRPALHSCFLEFDHPLSKEKMSFSKLEADDWNFLEK